MANKRITDVDFINSLNSNESFFINQNNTIKQINKNNVVLPVSSLGITATADELNVLNGITATTEELNKLDGVTATTTELNVLDGITATTEELNYVDGVTSNIQTQIDGKVSDAGDTMTGNLTFSNGGVILGSIASGASFRLSDAGIPLLSWVDVNGTQRTWTVTNVMAAVEGAMPKANFEFDASTGTLDITL